MGDFSFSKERFEEMMKLLDKDGDGSVDKEEYEAVYRKMYPNTTEEEFEGIWKKIDDDGNGSLSMQELAAYYGFNLDAETSAEMTDEQILEALQVRRRVRRVRRARPARPAWPARPARPARGAHAHEERAYIYIISSRARAYTRARAHFSYMHLLLFFALQTHSPQMQAALIEMNAEKEAALRKEREAKREAEELEAKEKGQHKIKDATIKMVDLEGKTRTGKVPTVLRPLAWVHRTSRPPSPFWHGCVSTKVGVRTCPTAQACRLTRPRSACLRPPSARARACACTAAAVASATLLTARREGEGADLFPGGLPARRPQLERPREPDRAQVP